jgi:proteasome accessory factor B
MEGGAVADPVERLVNLAFYLASAGRPVTAEEIHSEVDGYPPGQDADAFLRMFERDKEQLRDAGFAIEESEKRYRLDAASTFATEVDLAPEELAAIRAVGLALVDDPAFPFAEDLRLALAKLATSFEAPETSVVTRLATEQPARQGVAVATLDQALSARKRVTFGYTNQRGEHKVHDIEPFGLFAREGWWYLVGRDTKLDEVRVYAVARTDSLAVNPNRPKSPDFQRPEGFDVAAFIGMPFQYGPDHIDATVRISSEQAWRATALTAGTGTLEPDGTAILWRVTARDEKQFLRWLVEYGPGLELVAPERLARELRARIAEVAALHA